tara:strand:+ start:18720 stop:19220 length:501 start_codon:yes stop_codon:yes gene_type:complete
MSKALFISREDLVRYTPISGNLDFDRVIQYIEIAQDIHIHELLGGNLYSKLQADVLGSTLTGHYETLMISHIKPALSQYSLLEFLPFSQFSINNKGVFKHTSESAETLSKSDISMMVEATRDTAQHYATRMVDHLRNYPNNFPEYLTNTRDQISPNKDTSFGGWQI